MTEQEALARMVPPGKKRIGKPAGGVIQIWVTRACDKSCFNCTQGSNYVGKKTFISVEHFEEAVVSLRDYFGTVGVFGGNPALHPEFNTLCDILTAHIARARRGLWCNNPITIEKSRKMAETFNPAVSNLNVHLDENAHRLFKQGWPASRPFGLRDDSRHSPVYVSPIDMNIPEDRRWSKISECDINQHWSAMIGVFRGELRGYFCEIAGAMSMLRQDDPNWPDTGAPVGAGWWRTPMESFSEQVRLHCHRCGVPWRGYGAMAQGEHDQSEYTSPFWADVAKPKRPGRSVAVVATLEELQSDALRKMTDYMGNARA